MLNPEKSSTRLPSPSLIQCAGAFIIYFVAVLGVGYFAATSSGNDAYLWMSNQQVIEQFGHRDQGSYASGGRILLKEGGFYGSNQWYSNLWPPGMFVLWASLMLLLGENFPVSVGLFILNAALWSGLFALMAFALAEFMRKTFAFVIPLMFLGFSLVWAHMLSSMILLTEPISTALFLMFILLTGRAVQIGSAYAGVYAGICLGLSSYFRNTSESFLLVLTFVSIVLLILLVVMRRTRPSLFDGLNHKRLLYALGITIVVCHAVMLPWRAHNYLAHGSFSWSQALGLVLRQTWKELPKGSHVARFGGAIPCQVDPLTCSEVSERMRREGEWQVSDDYLKHKTIQSFSQHWWKWSLLKAKVALDRWIYEDELELFQANPNAQTHIKYRLHENLALLLAFLLTPALLCCIFALDSTKRTLAFLLLIIYISVAITLSATSVFVHIEPRYLYPWKLAFLLLFILSSSSLAHKLVYNGRSEDSAERRFLFLPRKIGQDHSG